MGLDMYLEKKTYVKNWAHDPEKKRVTTRKNGKAIPHIKSNRVKYVIEEVGYWRKDNHIHKWFVDNCQNGVDDCREYDVAAKQLVALREICIETQKYLKTCEKVVEVKPTSDGKTWKYWTYIVDETMENLLPTQGGFFFGSTEYDRWYEQSLKDTIKIIDNALKNVYKDGKYVSGDSVYFIYQSSW